MQNTFPQHTLFTALFLLTLALFGVSLLSAWTGPLAEPPEGNVDLPINTGGISQIKDGSLGVNALAVFGDTVFSGGEVTYTNYGETTGEEGYGFRDNDGVIEYKDNEGEWVALSSIEGGDEGVTPGSRTFTESGTFTVPEYNSMTVTVWGAGGSGGAGGCYYNAHRDGVDGGDSSFGNLVIAGGGGGGEGGWGGKNQGGANGTPGSGGVASGGDTNLNGSSGSGRNGGSAAGEYGDGGNGGSGVRGGGNGGGGGGGAMSTRTFDADAFNYGNGIAVTVGEGGNQVTNNCYGHGPSGSGAAGEDGRVEIEWN